MLKLHFQMPGLNNLPRKLLGELDNMLSPSPPQVRENSVQEEMKSNLLDLSLSPSEKKNHRRNNQIRTIKCTMQDYNYELNVIYENDGNCAPVPQHY